jgi:hypothetical protein
MGLAGFWRIEQVRAQLVARDTAVGSVFDLDGALGCQLFISVQPVPDMLLPDTNHFCQCRLTTNFIYQMLNYFIHADDHTTDVVPRQPRTWFPPLLPMLL